MTTMTNRQRRDANTRSVYDIMAEAGFRNEGTGGGCTAWIRGSPDWGSGVRLPLDGEEHTLPFYVMISDDGNAPKCFDRVTGVGLYLAREDLDMPIMYVSQTMRQFFGDVYLEYADPVNLSHIKLPPPCSGCPECNPSDIP